MNRRTFLRQSAMAGTMLALPTIRVALTKNHYCTRAMHHLAAKSGMMTDIKPIAMQALLAGTGAMDCSGLADERPGLGGNGRCVHCPACKTITWALRGFRCILVVWRRKRAGEVRNIWKAALPGDGRGLKNVDSPDGAWTDDVDPEIAGRASRCLRPSRQWRRRSSGTGADPWTRR